jgi:hypothetical protein
MDKSKPFFQHGFWWWWDEARNDWFVANAPCFGKPAFVK